MTLLAEEVYAAEVINSRLNKPAILEALGANRRRRGRKGYPVWTLWRCVLAKHYLGLPSTAALIRILHRNPFIARACGIESPQAIPVKSTFSKFYVKLFRLAWRLEGS